MVIYGPNLFVYSPLSGRVKILNFNNFSRNKKFGTTVLLLKRSFCGHRTQENGEIRHFSFLGYKSEKTIFI